MESPSLKNVTTEEIEKAIGEALAQLTGCASASVLVQALDFIDHGFGRTANMKIQVSLEPIKTGDLPF